MMPRPCGPIFRTAARWLSHHRASPLLIEPSALAREATPMVTIPVRSSYFMPHNSGLESTCIGPVQYGFHGIGAIQDIRQRECALTTLQQRRGLLSVGDGDEESDLSRHHEEDIVIGYSPEQLYAVVAAVDMYEDFVPWCQRSTVLSQKEDDFMEAELEIGFKFFVERYISHVELKKPTLIKTTVSQSTLFDYLTNIWEFKPGPTPHTTNLHFLVEFQFRSPLYRKVANMFFNEVAQRLVSSFENRCRTVYGPTMQERQEQQERHRKHLHSRNCQ